MSLLFYARANWLVFLEVQFGFGWFKLMLRIHTTTSVKAAKSYYTSGLKQENYYSQRAEITGLWHGAGAEKLDLGKVIEGKDFEALCENRSPVDGERLTGRNNANRRVGFDFTFNASKSVTLLYELTGDERIAEKFKEAVRDTMYEIERDAQVRVRENGAFTNRHSGNMIWGEFTHSTTRPIDGVIDPHLHTHCFAFNSSFDAVENKWKALELGDIRKDAPYYEAAFHARLALSLEKLGYDTQKQNQGLSKSFGWEIKGVERDTIEKFSRRTQEIEKIAKEKGIVDDRLKDGLGAKTRTRKSGNLNKGELRNEWLGRLSGKELEVFSALRGKAVERDVSAEIEEKAELSVDYALSHKLERQSVVSEKRLLESALRQGVGSVSVESVKSALLNRDDVLTRERDGRKFNTTREVLAEEKEMLNFERFGRGKHKSLAAGGKVKRDFLNAEQRSAVQHVWESYDRVIAIRGGAGVGKTTLMQEAVAGIESGGKKVSVFAPSSDASRGVLREEGFSDADTVQQLLVNERMQERVSGGVIWIDEAGLLGSRTLHKVFKIAEEQNARVVLSGDTKQHHSVERGDAFRLLQERGMAVAEVREIQRQEGDYKQAVKHLSDGDIEKGWQGLEDLEAIHEIKDPLERQEKIVAAYQEASDKGESVLVVSPTHAEARLITDTLRSSEKEAGRVGLEDKDFTVLASLNLTEAEREQVENFREGQVIQLHQNIKGFKRGEKAEVLGVDAEKGVVFVSDAGGIGNTDKDLSVQEEVNVRILPLDKAKHFQLYEKRGLGIAEGDKLRITQNGFCFDRDGKKHRLNNGAIYGVKGFSHDGGIELDNDKGWVIPKDYGHFNHGYVTTSHASQGKTINRVLIAQSSQSFKASSKEQFYVSVSRGTKGVEIFTDDKELLKEQISKSGERLSAHELVREQEKKESVLKQETTAERIKMLSRLKDWVRIQVTNLKNLKPKNLYGISYDTKQYKQVR